MANRKLEDIDIKLAIERAKKLNRRIELRDGKMTGLTLRASPSGSASWSVTWRQPSETRLRRKTIGFYRKPTGFSRLPILTLRTARISAADYLASLRSNIMEGQLVVQTSPPSKSVAPQFGELFNQWLERWAKPKLRSWEHEEKRYYRHLAARIGQVPINQLERKDFASIRDDLNQNSGPTESNRVVALFNRILNWSVDAGLVSFNPAARLRKVGKERASLRHLSNEGLVVFWTHLDALADWKPTPAEGARGRPIGNAMAIALKLYLLTAARRSELILAKKSEFLLDRAQPRWVIPVARVKNKMGDHIVPLSPTAVALIQEAHHLAGGSEFVFPSHEKVAAIRPDAVTRAMNRTIKAIDKHRQSDARLGPLSPHDLRRTATTLMAQSGVSREYLGYILNHTTEAQQARSTRHYDVGDHFEDKLAAILKLEQRIQRILQLPTGHRGTPRSPDTSSPNLGNERRQLQPEAIKNTQGTAVQLNTRPKR